MLPKRSGIERLFAVLGNSKGFFWGVVESWLEVLEQDLLVCKIHSLYLLHEVLANSGYYIYID